jgi:hypothetical protein
MDEAGNLSHTKWECKYHVVRRTSEYANRREGSALRWVGLKHGREPPCENHLVVGFRSGVTTYLVTGALPKLAC